MATQNDTLIVPSWINGKEEISSLTYPITSPSTNKVVWHSSLTTPTTILPVIESSQSAFLTWPLTKPTYRRDILLKAAAILEERTQEYASYMGTEMGAEIGISQFFAMPLGIQMLKDIAGRITGICGSVPACAAEGMSAMVWKEPYGVALGIVPW
jgi:acyl-CoA reductase-like NAD-dependent aldehyde dehydrogenase